MRVATEEFFSVMHSCCYLTGLGLNISVLFPSLVRITVARLSPRHLPQLLQNTDRRPRHSERGAVGCFDL